MAPFLEATSKQSQFSLDLCNAFLAADVPLHKLESEELRKFFEKYCPKQQLPVSSTLRLNYIESIYENKLECIRSFVADKAIWISLDETMDVKGRFVAHTIEGTMETTGSKSFLLHAECLDKTNSSTISQVFMKTLAILWPDGVRHDKVHLFLTDGAKYVKKAGLALKVIFPRMLHVTCVAHGLHRVAEECHRLFPDVDKLIAGGKKVFRKSAARVTLFRELHPNVPLPPRPVVTRWGTWLDAAVYYATYLDQFSSVVDTLDEDDAASIEEVQQLLKRAALREDLAYIAAHFSDLPDGIKKLEGHANACD